MEFSVSQIASLLEGRVVGDGERKIRMLSKIQDAKQGEISFLSNPKYEKFIYTTEASAVIVGDEFSPKEPVTTTLVHVKDPYTSFTVLLEEYHKFLTFQKEGVESPSYIGDETTVGAGIYRGAFSYIGSKSRIGDNVKIYPHSFIGDNVTIGDNTIVHSGVKIYNDTVIGANCVLHSGVVVGSDGFGFAPQADGSYKTIPQMGHVVIKDHVNIGANTVIDCATMHGDATIINEGVKLDNLIQIAHNVEIGKHTVIASQTGVSGSTQIGAHSIIAGQVGIAGHLKLADKTSIGAQSGVGKNVDTEGQKIQGSPGIDLNSFYRAYAVFKNLPDLNKRLNQLEEKVLNLPAFEDKP